MHIEWCPDPFQWVQKQTGEVTEPEIWESDSEGIGRTSSVSSASAPDGRCKKGYFSSSISTSTVREAS